MKKIAIVLLIALLIGALSVAALAESELNRLNTNA